MFCTIYMFLKHIFDDFSASAKYLTCKTVKFFRFSRNKQERNVLKCVGKHRQEGWQQGPSLDAKFHCGQDQQICVIWPYIRYLTIYMVYVRIYVYGHIYGEKNKHIYVYVRNAKKVLCCTTAVARERRRRRKLCES